MSLRLPNTGFQGAQAYLATVTKTGGGGGYGDKTGATSYQPGNTPTRTMTSVGMLARLFMGAKPNDPLLRGGAEWCSLLIWRTVV